MFHRVFDGAFWFPHAYASLCHYCVSLFFSPWFAHKGLADLVHMSINSLPVPL